MLKNFFKPKAVVPVLNEPVAPDKELTIPNNEVAALPKEVDFNLNTIYKAHYNVTYRGIKYIRCPFDYVIYQMLVNEVQPDLIIEIGTNIGGGALYLADILNVIGKGIVHTIDINNSAHELVLQHERIKFFTTGWENYDLKEAEGFEKILVIDDGSHQYRQVIQALHKFSPLVTKGSYYIVEDGIVGELDISERFEGGPLRAVTEFMAEPNDFIIDRRWCDFFGHNATFNVNGYLKRVQK